MDTNNVDELIIATSTVLMGCAAQELESAKWQNRRKPRKIWVKPWLSLRETVGAYQALVLEFSSTEQDEYHRFMRMDPETFEVINRVFLDIE